jgi:aspartate racemase
LEYLITGAKALENGGAQYIVIPCNSVHVLIEDIRRAVNIPVISIVEETLKYIQKHHISNIGVLSTSVTSQYKLYESIFTSCSIDYLVVSPSEQIELNQVIYNLVQ